MNPINWLPPNDSFFWVLARQAVIIVPMSAFAIFAYKNKMSPTDIAMILTTMGALFGVDIFKRNAAPPTPPTNPPSE